MCGFKGCTWRHRDHPGLLTATITAPLSFHKSCPLICSLLPSRRTNFAFLSSSKSYLGLLPENHRILAARTAAVKAPKAVVRMYLPVTRAITHHVTKLATNGHVTRISAYKTVGKERCPIGPVLKIQDLERYM